ncbi:mucolipin [Tieghemostelium lacteum]|uniref:Mucolipin n=1 Tax=Tieghemostelium lacteum TaxID=361077 RepID=A0A152A2A5_TIELA|nr:mucolipin [Tieghemostelium lacteum]|eukprot:KYR00340.1 mucolipin [Tieghemostelium lacteum]
MIFHILTVLVLTTQLFLIHSTFTVYRRNSIATFHQVFLKNKSEDGSFISVVEFLDILNKTVEQYYQFPQQSIDTYQFFYNTTSGGGNSNHVVPVPIDMEIQYFTGSIKKSSSTSYQIDSNSLGPFNRTNSKQLLQQMEYITCSFRYRNTAYSILGKVDYIWTIEIQFQFGNHGGKANVYCLATPEIDQSGPSQGSNDIVIFKILNILLFLFSLVLLVLGIKRIIQNIKLLIKSKKRFQRLSEEDLVECPYKKWQEIPYSVRIGFISLWNISNLIGNIWILFATSFTLGSSPGISSTEYYRILIGLGSFITSVNLIKYLTYNERLYTLILTIERSFTRAARFIFSCSPIIFAYVLCGVSLFSEYSQEFQDLSSTCETLFALLNGDDIHSTFQKLDQVYPYPLLAKIYLYSFITLFVVAILNIFIFVIESSYISAKDTLKKKKHRFDSSRHHQHKNDFDIEKLLELLVEKDDPNQPISQLNPSINSINNNNNNINNINNNNNFPININNGAGSLSSSSHFDQRELQDILSSVNILQNRLSKIQNSGLHAHVIYHTCGVHCDTLDLTVSLERNFILEGSRTY